MRINDAKRRLLFSRKQRYGILEGKNIGVSRTALVTSSHLKLRLGEGWLVSLALPASDSPATNLEPFSDGEPQMVCDLKYLGEEGYSVRLKDAMRASGIDKDLKI
jgi:hypothetical protein